jgi:lipid-binding SYLF domain-containing protein
VLKLGTEEEANMNSRKYLWAFTTVALVCASLVWAADDKDESDINKRIDSAANVLNEIMGTPDKAIPDNIMSDARCIAVIPSMVKIAIGIGGNHGKGVATCRTPNGWSAPAPITITGGSWGLQLGGQAVDLVMVVTNDQGMQHLLSSKFKLGADASAAAGPVGRDATAGTDVKLRAEVLTYSRTRGLFAGIDLSGAVVNQDKDSTRILYGKMIPFETILNGKVAPPNGSDSFLAAVRKYSSQSKNQAEK